MDKSGILLKSLAFQFLLIFIMVLLVTRSFAALPEDAPPLPPPTGTVVYVSTWAELIDAVWNLESNTTIMVEPGIYTIPDYWFINVGIDQENPITNITIRGATGDFDDVIIKGTAPGMTGASSFGFYINNATNVTIADITVGEVYHHAVQINPPQIGAANGLRLYHCRFYDCGEQIIKGNFIYDDQNMPKGAANGSIEYCLIEYTSWGPTDGYTEGIDLHAAENWNISNNLLRNIRVPENAFHTCVPAILIWNNSQNVTVTGNIIINCDRGIAFGLNDRTTLSGFPEVNTGIISNNMFYRQQNQVFYDDAAILAWDVRQIKIVNNTVFDEAASYPAIEYRFVKNQSDITIANNLLSPATNGTEPVIWDRDNDLGNPEEDYENAWVVSNFTELSTAFLLLEYPGDLHLNTENAATLFGIESCPECIIDFDGGQRGTFTHYGADSFFSGTLATHSFSNHSGGTYPNTLVVSGNEITVDMSSISGAHIYRAVLNPGKNFNYYNLTANSFFNSTMTITSGGDTLELLAPRYKTFDAGKAVLAATNNGSILTLHVADQGSGFGDRVTLDVLCDLALPGVITQVPDASVNFINGDAIITFTEVNPPINDEAPSYETFFNTYQNVMDGNVRYRIYRSTIPIESTEDILGAELIDEIYPLSGWNPKYHGPERVFPFIGKEGTVTRLPVADQELAAVGCGIYVNRYTGDPTEQSAWYFISHTVDGAEDFSVLTQNNNITNGITESPGSGAVLLHSVLASADFIYEGPSTLYYFVKWECNPAATFPSDATNYLVALRNDIDYTAINPGVIIKMHSWGGTMNHNFGWWHYADQGHILVSGNQFPWQNWWLGHHSSLGTLKSYHDGVVKPFTAQRFLDFVYDHLQGLHNIDENKIVLSGTSMGGTGTSIIGTRNGHIFSNLIEWVGVHNPSQSPTFEPSFEIAFGDSAWHCNFSNVEFAAKYGGEQVLPEDNYDVWNYYNNTYWLTENPGAEAPWHTFSNGSNDTQIGWPQAQEYAQTALVHKIPINFTWGTGGHEQRAKVLDPYGYETDRRSNLVFRLNQSFPVFTNSTMAGNIQIDDVGEMNNYFKWDTETIVDDINRWEISINLIPASPQEFVSTSVTPRRVQHFIISPDAAYSYAFFEDELLISSGIAIADPNGLLTIDELEISKDSRRLVLSPAEETVLTTLSATSVTASTATLHGNIETLGTPVPTSHGFCWSETPNPTIASNRTDEGSANATGMFSSNLSWLSGNTTYYFRAYAGNSNGTSYGSEISFTTEEYGNKSWTGNYSNEWDSGSNWSDGQIPTINDNVIIPQGTPGNPRIVSGATADCHNLFVQPGAALTVMAGGSIITGGNITNEGNISIALNIDDEVWHYVSSPVSNATAAVFEGNYLQSWSEVNAEWSDITNLSATLDPVKGYGLWQVAPGNEFIFSGTPNTGTHTMNVSLSSNFPDPGIGYDGANLLGNPYPSSIDWSYLDDIWGAVYFWNPDANDGNGDYLEWNNGLGSGSQYIAAMQGFFIVAGESNTSNGAGTVTISNTARTHMGASNFYKGKSAAGFVIEAKSGNFSDNIHILFSQDATRGFDLKYDALKFYTETQGVSQISTLSQNLRLAIDVRPVEESVQLCFANDQAGIYTIGISKSNEFFNVLLEDTKTNIFHHLTPDSNRGDYEFVWDVNDDETRFKLHFNPVGVEETPAGESKILIYTANNQIFIKGAENGEVMVSDVMGRIVLQQEIPPDSDQSRLVSIPVNFKTGVYLVMVSSDEAIKSEKVFIK
ncbi:MAG: DUF6383 domain-containing protein [Bacteroidales bacterium]|nr:DUF6383 domain-containing protein [Bacteroidales bacterium]